MNASQQDAPGQEYRQAAQVFQAAIEGEVLSLTRDEMLTLREALTVACEEYNDKLSDPYRRRDYSAEDIKGMQRAEAAAEALLERVQEALGGGAA